jgi:uncharacterized damage-inducible protein DinB
MKELLLQYAMFNLWANQRMSDAIIGMDENLHQQIVKSSFPNLYATMLHLWDVESIWFQRIHGHEKVVIPSKSFNPSMREAINGLLNHSQQWVDHVNSLSDTDLHQMISYRNIAGEHFTQPLFQLIHHLFNHQTYHRGQLVTMMRELGETKLPGTDFVTWARENSH